MNLKDIWIGEKVRILSSGRAGTFEGINKEGKARIKTDDDKILLVKSSNIGLYQEESNIFTEIDRQLGLVEKKKHTEPLKITLNNQIDLHIEILAPHLINELPARIHSYQVEACENFIRKAIGMKLPRVVIIHGKGEGVLRTSVEHIVRQYKEVNFVIPINDGGALELWINN